MTKAEMKRREKEARVDFIVKTYKVVLESLAEQTKDVRKNLHVRISQQNNNRYIRFHRQGKDLAIVILADGKVVIELDEMCHEKHREQLIDYAMEGDRKEAFWAELRETLSWLFKIFLDQYEMDFHAYMDYVGRYEKMTDAYMQMKDDCDKYLGSL